VTLENLGDRHHIWRDVVGQGFLEFGEGVVPGQDSTRADTAVARGGDIVLHVPDEKGLLRAEVVVLQDSVDGIALVRHPGIGLPEKVVYAQTPGLLLKVRLMHRAEQKHGKILGMAVFKNFPGARQQEDRVMQFPKDLTENLLQLVQGCMRDVLFVEAFVGEIEFLPKGGTVERGLAVGGKNTVGGLQDRGEVVHQSARPVKNQIPNHDLSVFVNVNVSRERSVPNGKV
jgi:hypothetical protein